MKIFKTTKGIFLFEDYEISNVRSCQGFRQVGAVKRTNCISEGCYSINNPESKFFEGFIEHLCKLYNVEESIFDNIRNYIDTSDGVHMLDFFYGTCEYRNIIKGIINALYDKEEDEIKLASLISKYIVENEEHTTCSLFYTGNGDEVQFLDQYSWDEITNEEKGEEIIENFKGGNFSYSRYLTKSGVICIGLDYIFFKSSIKGENGGFRVEKRIEI